jgi:hypothetical protein
VPIRPGGERLQRQVGEQAERSSSASGPKPKLAAIQVVIEL